MFLVTRVLLLFRLSLPTITGMKDKVNVFAAKISGGRTLGIGCDCHADHCSIDCSEGAASGSGVGGGGTFAVKIGQDHEAVVAYHHHCYSGGY